MRSARRMAASGFTLIELLVVVVILIILAGLVLPKLDKIQLKANKGVAANNAAGTSRYIQTFRIMHNVYPDGWDSLLDPTHTTLSTKIDPQLIGGGGGPTKLRISTSGEALNGTDSTLRSLTRMGITKVYDEGAGSNGFPSDVFTSPARLLADGDVYATINEADGDGLALIQHLYPDTGTVTPGKQLIVLGFGVRNTTIGDVLQECPFYSNGNLEAYYGRFLAIFQMDTGGGRVELMGVVGADADRIDEEIGDFYDPHN